MMTATVRIIITVSVAICLGIILGNSAVYFFNRIPGKWLVDYGEEPDEELLHPTHQRISSVPWKYCFSCLFIMAGVFMGLRTPAYAAMSLLVCWLLLIMAISDIKYMIVPDQLILLLLLSGMGFIPFQLDKPTDGIIGAAIGLGIMLLIGTLGKLLYKKPTLGGADIKLYTAMGLVVGYQGILTVFVLMTIIMAVHILIEVIMGKAKKDDIRPMVPYLAIAATIYIVILREIGYNIMIVL